MSERFKIEKEFIPDVEIPPVSEETLEKLAEKPEIPPISEETLEKIEQKVEIIPLSGETREEIEKKIEIPPVSEETLEKLAEKPEIPPISEETKKLIEKESSASVSPEASSPPQQILNYMKEKTKGITETGAKIKIGGKILNLFLFSVAAMALLFVGGTWYFLKGFKSLVKKSIEQITGEKFEKKDKK